MDKETKEPGVTLKATKITFGEIAQISHDFSREDLNELRDTVNKLVFVHNLTKTS